MALNEIEIEKTEVLEQQVEIKKEKPSLLKRLIKYTLIGFAILFVLAILDEENKNQADTETVDISVVEQDVMPDKIETDFNSTALDVDEQFNNESMSEKESIAFVEESQHEAIEKSLISEEDRKKN